MIVITPNVCLLKIVIRMVNAENNKMPFKIETAQHLLLINSIRICEVAYKIEFNDPKYFSQCFKNEYGITPSRFRSSFRIA